MTRSAFLMTLLDASTDAIRSPGIFNQEIDGFLEIRMRGIRCKSKSAAGTRVVSKPEDVPKNIN